MKGKVRVAVIGGGGWGTALAVQSSKKNDVVLWFKFEEEAEEVRKTRFNQTYLPDVKIPDSIEITTSMKSALEKADVILFVVPSRWADGVLDEMRGLVKKKSVVVSCTKGFEPETGKRISQVIEEKLPESRVAVLSGPSHAEEVARDVPTSVVVASRDIRIAKKVQHILSTDTFRVYRSRDVVGVELGGALKNIIAIASGIADGLGLGDNSKAALITRGLAEIRRLGIKMGAKSETFMGLSGVGDLIVTCMSKYSRNRKVGEIIGRGKKLEDILSEMKMVAEGVWTSKLALKLADKYGVEMPITREVVEILFSGKDPKKSISDLMTRSLKPENWM